MSTQTLTSEAERYLAEVRAQLDDLPEEDRIELIDDVSQHLAAIVEEGSDTDLRVRLGAPITFANEMRLAAGLDPRGDEAIPPPEPSRLRRWVTELWAHRWTRAARQFCSDLAPGWWVLRGVLIGGLPFWTGHDANEHIPIPRPGGEALFGLTLMFLAVVGSVALGKMGKKPRGRRPLRLAG